MKPKRPSLPPQREESLRHQIIHLLQQSPVSAMDISREVGIPEKEVYDHLDHIRTSLHRKGLTLSVTPAQCRKCSFKFVKRSRLNRPGKCPVCRSQSISAPHFNLDGIPRQD